MARMTLAMATDAIVPQHTHDLRYTECVQMMTHRLHVRVTKVRSCVGGTPSIDTPLSSL